jgi:hypothetical protein
MNMPKVIDALFLLVLVFVLIDEFIQDGLLGLVGELSWVIGGYVLGQLLNL